MQYLKQSTTINLKVGPALDASDGVTPVVSPSGYTPVANLSKNGGTIAARNSATAIAWDGTDGWITVELDTTDTNTLGRLTVFIADEAQHLQIWHEFMVLPANVYDSLVSATDQLQVDVQAINDSAAAANVAQDILDDGGANDLTNLTVGTVTDLTNGATVSGTVAANLTQINGTTAGVAEFKLWADSIDVGTVDTTTNGHTPTTTELQADDITEATADHYVGRMILFTSGALIKQRRLIISYEAVGGIGQFTTLPFTEAPANDDTFVVT